MPLHPFARAAACKVSEVGTCKTFTGEPLVVRILDMNCYNWNIYLLIKKYNVRKRDIITLSLNSQLNPGILVEP